MSSRSCSSLVLAATLALLGGPALGKASTTTAKPDKKAPAAATAPLPPAALSPRLAPTMPEPTERLLQGPTLSPAPQGSPDDPDPVYSAFQRGLWLRTMALAIPRAEAGDPAAMTMIGTLYEGGLGITADLAKAAKWYGLAADKGDREGRSALAQMYVAGRGVPKDLDKAWTLFAAAAAQDQPIALFNGAVMMFDGRHAPHDPEKATDWLKRSAELGAIEAQYAYAGLLADPENPRHDPLTAAHWMREAAMSGFEAAEVEFALMLLNGRGVAKSPENAFVWFHRSALRGNAIGRNRLARMYAVGIGTAPDPVAALTWHTLAKRQGLPDIWLETRLANLSDADRRRAILEADRIATRGAGEELDTDETSQSPSNAASAPPPARP